MTFRIAYELWSQGGQFAYSEPERHNGSKEEFSLENERLWHSSLSKGGAGQEGAKKSKRGITKR